MPKAKFKCDLCEKPLRNLDEARVVHDRTCRGFKILHRESVAFIHQSLAQQQAAGQAPPEAPAPEPMQVDDEPPRPPTPKTRASGLPNRKRRVPARLKDAAPPPPPRLPRGQKRVAAPEPLPEPVPAPELEPQKWVRTRPNAFGLYKVYPQRPLRDPDSDVTAHDVYLVPKPGEVGPDDLALPEEPWYYPFPNASIANMIKYHVEEDNANSIGGFDRLVATMHPDPQNTEFDGVNPLELPHPWSTKTFLDLLDKKGIEPLGTTAGWIQGSVSLRLPCVGHPQNEADAPTFMVTDIHYRPLLDVVHEVLQGPLFEKFHTTPFSLRFDPSFDEDALDISMEEVPASLDECGLPPLPQGHEDVFAEVYTSRAMLEAFSRLPQPPPPQKPDDPVESIIVGILEWSDATHLAQFGTASLWPGYTFFANHPKDFRNKPKSHAGFHQAYFTQLPDTIRDTYREHYGCEMPDEVFRHLKRDLMHQIWELLLSDDFMEAYDNGIKIRCWDGLVRLVFPRFFIYGADYPEKVLLATIKSLGTCPCPRCLIKKNEIAQTGTVNDLKRRQVLRVDDHHRRSSIERARRSIFESGSAVEGSTIDGMLKSHSWVPTRNAFAKLNTEKTPFNFYSMFVPDLLHEVELGVAKALILHLIRMLQTFKNLDIFDARFRQIETFGRGTIRGFRRSVSDMKYVAARDFEDILQCILPVIDGLFPAHQSLVDKLCFEMALWHGYAKLRMHTTSTIKLFTQIGKEWLFTIRSFARETSNIKTYELDKEHRKRVNKAAKDAAAPNPAQGRKGKGTATANAGGRAAAAIRPNGRQTSKPSKPPRPQSRVAVSSERADTSKSDHAAGADPTVAVAAPPNPDPTEPSTLDPASEQQPSMPAVASTSSAQVGAVTSSQLSTESALEAEFSSAHPTTRQPSHKLEKPFNLITYKLHSIPDYPESIMSVGTTDATSTQTGELAHRLVKLLYRRTNRKNHARQIANHEHRRRMMRAMWDRRRRYKLAQTQLARDRETPETTEAPPSLPLPVARDRRSRKERSKASFRPKPVPGYGAYVPPDQHHYISDSTKNPCDLLEFASLADADSDSGEDGPPLPRVSVQSARFLLSLTLIKPVDPGVEDPALKDFLPKLRTYLRRYLLGILGNDQPLSNEALLNVVIKKDLLYAHATMQVNYTTYDVRRAQDVLNPRTRRFFIVHAQDPIDSHKFWYGEIIGIFHCYVLLADYAEDNDLGQFQRVEFLWVRWFQRDMSYRCGFEKKRLPRVNYIYADDPDADAFGFLDPHDVVRGCHLIPAFRYGRTVDYLPKSIARRSCEGDQDWTFYYANLFVLGSPNVVGHRKPVPESRQTATDAPLQTDSEPHAPDPSDTSSALEHEDGLGGPETADDVEREDDDDWRGDSGSESGSDEEADANELMGDDAIRDRLQLAE
uniref:C2H2-type domain-containing protein n=1 Tax=Mycena chlorophos TaxID=658473 RepID=A0ABQ0L866_MYCCL|nr:predicted protein [Mycena chlorophos]